MWDIIWVSPQGHISVSVSRHFLLQALQCPCSVRKRFSRDHCCRERSNPGCQIVGSHTGWQLTTRADFQLCLHRLLMSTGCKFSQLHWLPVTDRINYKLCLFVYKALHGFMPDYLSELCIPASSVDYRSHLRSAHQGDVIVPRVRLAVSGPLPTLHHTSGTRYQPIWKNTTCRLLTHCFLNVLLSHNF